MSTVTITVDDQEVEVDGRLTLLQALQSIGKEVPHFCFHERLSIAGNCRMCLVEVEKERKPVASCAMPLRDGLVVHTDSEMTRNMRKGVMEFLLINHPLDCPICDQGGECDLQDQAMAYGFDRTRYHENKRAVADKEMGPLVATEMTRCIHCTRCVRFAQEIAGVEELGALFRGEDMEITSYLEKSLTSELSANVIDLCPVGALTSKPYAFAARPWELRKTESVDVMDAVGSNIRVDSRGSEVMRVLPRMNDDINEEWISDKTRYACDGLKRQRLDRPYLRKDGKLEETDWPTALEAVAAKLNSLPASGIAAIAGDQVDCESMFALKSLMDGLGVANLDCRQDGAAFDPDVRASYLFNSTIAGIEGADALLIIGSNPRLEAPILNARIRKRWLMGDFPVAAIGDPGDLTYRYEKIGAGPDTLKEVLDGSHSFAEVLQKAERPMLILGMGALTRSDGPAILAAARELADKVGMIADGWNGFNILHTAAGRVGGLDLGFVPGEGGKSTSQILEAAGSDINMVWLLGADEIDADKLKDTFVVYQGHHGDAGAHVADVILPGAAYTEKNATYVNTEGRPQRGFLAAFPPGEAKEDWAILRALSAILGQSLPFNTLAELRVKMEEACPVLADVDDIAVAEWRSFGEAGDLGSAPFASPVDNFYMTDPISRCSETMARCTEMARSLKSDAA